MDRVSRYLSGKKQDKIRVVNFQPSVQSMREGEEVLFFNKNGSLSRYRKEKGLLWRSDMNTGNNRNIEGRLIVNNLEYRTSFVDYRVFMHNFEDDINTSKVYMPWWGTTESTGMDDHRVGFVTPFKMTLHKIIIRADNLTGSDDITIRVEKQDNDNTEDVVATAVYDVSSSGAISSDTNFELNKSDFDNAPTVDAGKLCGLSIQASSDIMGNQDFYISSVWRVEVEI